MAQIQSGVDSTLLTVDPTFNAARVSIRPPELTGAYRISKTTGNIAAATAAASILAAFRYTGTGVAVVTSVRVGLNVITAYTAGSIVLSLYSTRSYTVTETTNYTAATLTTNNAKLRTSHATTASAFGVATTTGITGGTGTDDTQPLGSATFNLPATITGQPVQDFFTFNMSSHPIVLGQNEGFRIRNDTAFAATGVSNLVVMVEWFEATAY
jgi:hypothetical protein